MDAQVLQLDGRLLLDWTQLGEDATAWMELQGQGSQWRMRLVAVDPDIDFSYDYPDLDFQRTGNCR
jgi:hypothetical protein